MVGNWWGIEHWPKGILWKKVLPSLDRSGFQFWIRVTYNDKTGVSDTIDRARLLLNGTDKHLGRTRIRFARAYWPHHPPHKCVRLEKPINLWGFREIKV
jgi:hypothetical protein